jgi:hypothetical protein
VLFYRDLPGSEEEEMTEKIIGVALIIMVLLLVARYAYVTGSAGRKRK